MAGQLRPSMFRKCLQLYRHASPYKLMYCRLQTYHRPQVLYCEKMKGCKADIQDFETKLTRGQYKNVCYMLEVYYNISKKLTMFTKSCRDAEEEYPPKFLKVLGEGSNWGKHAHIFTTIS